jgi:RNA polymerase sigma-70 factor (ECF subfamily)
MKKSARAAPSREANKRKGLSTRSSRVNGRFAGAVEQLDEADRQIVLLKHFEHLSTAEAADALGLSKPAAGMRYLRAMRRLRVLLDEG